MNVSTCQENSRFIRVVFTESSSKGLQYSYKEIDDVVEKIRSEFEKSPLPVLFDFSGLEHIDSTVITVLVQTSRYSGERKKMMLVTRKEIEEVLLMLGMDAMFEMYGSEQEIGA